MRGDRAESSLMSGDGSVHVGRAVARTFFADVPFGVAVLTPEGRYVRVNAEFARANGPTPQEHEGLLVEEVLDAGKEQVRALLDEVVRTGASVVADADVADHTGTLRSWQTVWLPALDEHDRLEGVIAVGMDVTEQRRAEQARALAEQRSALLAGWADLLDAGLDVDLVSRRLVQLLVRDVASWAALHLAEPDGSVRFAAVAARDAAQEEELREALAAFQVTTEQPAGAGRAIATGETQLVPQIDPVEIEAVAGADRRFLEVMVKTATGDGLVVPLRARGRVLGAVSIARNPDGLEQVLDLDDLATLVGRAALALDNALLFARQSQISLTLQRALLPPVL